MRTPDDDLVLTPRTTAVLRTALRSLAASIRRDVEHLGDRPLVLGEHRFAALDRLPRACWTEDARWRRRLAGAADDLDAALAAGRLPRPRCPGEELCLHLAIEDAADAVDDDATDDVVRGLPEDDLDYDWDTWDELLLGGSTLVTTIALAEAVLSPREWFTSVDRGDG